MTARLYNAFNLAMFVSVLMSRDEWLEMRVNMGWVFFGLAVILFAVQSAVKLFRRLCSTFAVSLLCVAVSFGGMYLVLGAEGLPVIPAAIIREGLMQSRLTFSAINTALIIAAAAGLIAVFFTCGHEH